MGWKYSSWLLWCIFDSIKQTKYKIKCHWMEVTISSILLLCMSVISFFLAFGAVDYPTFRFVLSSFP